MFTGNNYLDIIPFLRNNLLKKDNNMILSKLCTTAQVAKKYGLSQKRILQLIQAGYIKAWKSDGRFVIPEEDLPATPTWSTKPGPKGKARKTSTKLNQKGPRGVTGELLCEACLAANHLIPAITRSQNPDYAGYNLCGPCAHSYNGHHSASQRPTAPKPHLCPICAKPVEAGRVFHEACTLPESDIDK
jgi:hypothetical protein